MKLLLAVILVASLATSCLSIPLSDVAEQPATSAESVTEADYLYEDEDFASNLTTSFLCLDNCTCTSSLGDSVVEVDCNGRDITAIPIPEKDFEIYITLDFSCNDLVALGNHSFRYYPLAEVILLFLDELETVEVDSFNGLNNLKEVDLSSNYIMYIPADVFKDNPNLERVILSNNPLVQMSATSPLLNAPALEYLDVSNCKLKSLTPESFVNLKSLRNLDFSSNYLQTMSVDTLVEMQALEAVNFDNNRFLCSCELQALLDYLDEISSRSATTVEPQQPIRCVASEDGAEAVWALSSSVTNCQNETLLQPIVIAPETEGAIRPLVEEQEVSKEVVFPATEDTLEPIVMGQEVSEEVEIEIIYVQDNLPSLESTSDPIDEHLAMSFGSITFYLRHHVQSIYASLVIVAIIVTTVLLSVVCLKIILNSRSERADAETLKKQNLMLSFGVGFDDKRHSFAPLLESPDVHSSQSTTPPACEWRPMSAVQYDNPQSLFEEYVNSRRPYNVCEANYEIVNTVESEK